MAVTQQAARTTMHRGNASGQMTPTFLLLGVYSKIVKVAGSDRLHNQRA